MQDSTVAKNREELLIEAIRDIDFECKFCENRKGTPCKGTKSFIECYDFRFTCMCYSCRNRSKWTFDESALDRFR